MPLAIVHNPAYDAHFSPDHRFPMSKYRLLAEAIMEEGLAGPGDFHVPAPAPAQWVKLAHDPAYVDQVFACAVPREIEKEIGFEVTERTALRARCAVAGTVMAARLALEHGVALPRQALSFTGDPAMAAFLADWAEDHPGQVVEGGPA